MRRLFGFGLAVVLILWSAPLSPARADEPDWYPLNAINDDLATDIIKSVTRHFRVLREDEIFAIIANSGKIELPWDTTPIVSVWRDDVSVGIRIDPKTNLFPESTIADLQSLAAFVTLATSNRVTLQISSSEEDEAFHKSNLLIDLSKKFGYRDPYYDNPIRMDGVVKTTNFGKFDDFLCLLVCRVLHTEIPVELYGGTASDAGNQILTLDEYNLMCCRLIDKEAIVASQFYEWTELPDTRALESWRGVEMTPRQRYYGQLRRVLIALIAGLGVRNSAPDEHSLVFKPSPAEQARAPSRQIVLRPIDVFERSPTEATSGWAMENDLFHVCNVSMDRPDLDGATQTATQDEIGPECLALHRAVAIWNLVKRAGIRSGDSPEGAKSKLLDFVHKQMGEQDGRRPE